MPPLQLPTNGLVVTMSEVVPAWLDYNEHMNVAYYLVAFETGIDAYKNLVGLTPAYIAGQRRSTVALEAHITYQREASLGDVLRIETRVLDCDGKRAHIFQEMYRGTELLSTQETLSLSFDLSARRSAPFESHIAAGYAALIEAQRALPRPAWVGRAIGITQGRPAVD